MLKVVHDTIKVQTSQRFKIENCTKLSILNYGDKAINVLHKGISILIPSVDANTNLPLASLTYGGDGTYGDIDIFIDLKQDVGNVIIMFSAVENKC